jgi:polyhydroxyalkanoate synthesis regulator phasin
MPDPSAAEIEQLEERIVALERRIADLQRSPGLTNAPPAV